MEKQWSKLPYYVNIGVVADFKRLPGGIRVHFGYSIIVHGGINGELLDSGGDEEASGVSANDLYL